MASLSLFDLQYNVLFGDLFDVILAVRLLGSDELWVYDQIIH